MLKVGMPGGILGVSCKYFNQCKLMPTNHEAQLRATIKETHEMQLVLLYKVLGFRRDIKF